MNILVVQHLSKRFMGLQALRGISFEIREGQIVGLIGPNGAGKSTLFNILGGNIRPDEGRIHFKEKNILELKPHEICKEGLARTFQSGRPFLNMTVLENVRMGAFNRNPKRLRATEKAAEVCEFLRIEGKMNHLCRSLTLQDQRKVELARAVATEPKLLLLDEVMAGLNPAEIDEMIDMIGHIRRFGMTVLVIEHIMKAIMKISDYLIVINFGELIAQGLPAAMARDERVIQAYLGEDFRFAQPA
jgi:branched-chain amino acid transport system ATP-binding protein